MSQVVFLCKLRNMIFSTSIARHALGILKLLLDTLLLVTRKFD
jgi:hypothetical protein